MQYITHGVTPGVVTQYVPDYDDGVSSEIFVQFPFGARIQSSVFVRMLSVHTFIDVIW